MIAACGLPAGMPNSAQSASLILEENKEHSIPGRIDASTTNKLFVFQTLAFWSTTLALEFVPILQDPVQWF
jgi:hypothetical protein